MKVKHFDKLQTYALDAIWQRIAEGRDVPQILVDYTKWADVDPDGLNGDQFIGDFHEKLRDFPPVDPEHGKWRTWGFAVPFHGQPEEFLAPSSILSTEATYDQSLVVNIPGTNVLVLCVEKREKVLPASAINDKLFERAATMKEREQRDLTRKDYAILKEEVTASMLTTAPVRRVRTYMMLTNGDLHVFTGSQKAAEECTALLRNALSSLPTVPAFKGGIIQTSFFKDVVNGETKHFVAGTYIKLKNDEKEIVTIKDGDINGEERVTEMLERKFEIQELEFHCTSHLGSRIWVKMNLKSDIKYLATEEEEDGTAEFHEQYDVGDAGYQSKMAELWMLVRIIDSLHEMFRDAGLMIDRSGNTAFEETGDELDELFQKALSGAMITAAEGEDQEDDEGAFDDEVTQDDEDDEWAID